LRGGPVGDLVARVVFEVPTRLTGKQRGALEELAKTLDPGNFPEARAFGDRLKTFYSRRDKLNSRS
jgi:DnaJ-class molecular chaperone